MESELSPRTCPQCGQELASGVAACPKCGQHGANPYASPVSVDAELPVRALGWPLISSVAVVISVSIIVGIVAPGIGVLLALVFVPAVVRTVAVLQRREAAGMQSDSPSRILMLLLACAGVSFAAWIASSIAFSIVCVPIGIAAFALQSDWAFSAGIGLAILFQIAVFVWLMRRYWPPAARNQDAAA
jgi:hypothetical protein